MFFFLMMYLLWVVTNQWIFTEIGHGFVFFNVVYFVMAYCCQYIIDIFCIDSVQNLFVLLLNILKNYSLEMFKIILRTCKCTQLCYFQTP